MGNEEKRSQTDYISTDVLNRMSLTLDYDLTFESDAVVPKLWHWLYFLPQVKASETGVDGHPKRGDFMPAIEGLDRRMWAGSRFWFHDHLYASRYALKESQVIDVKEKEGRSGRLAFVCLRHEYYQDNRHVITEEQDIVYKPAPKSDSKIEDFNSTLKPPFGTARWSQNYKPDPVLLFKYSALTFNGHRIHYDRDFCKNEFGFPGLVVHGPLLATLLIELIRNNIPDVNLLEYSFRAKGPVFDLQTFKVEGYLEGNTVYLWAVNQDGFETITARAKIEKYAYQRTAGSRAGFR